MAASPTWKVYNAQGEYLAACKHAVDAARLVSYHDRGTVRHGHRFVVWNQGEGASHEHAAEVMHERVHARARGEVARCRASLVLSGVARRCTHGEGHDGEHMTDGGNEF